MKLENILDDRGINYEKHAHPVTYTAQRLADVEHVTGYMVAKPVIVKASGGYAMCVIAAPRHLDLRRVAAVVGEPQVELATEAEMAELFADCELGAEPPIGSIFGLVTIVDSELQSDEHILMQSGTHTDAIKMRRLDWERLCDPIYADIIR